MIDIRKKIKELLQDYGHHIVYVRRDEKFRCKCYIERSGEPSVDCSKCFGTGYVVQLTKVQTRRNISSVPETLIGANTLMDHGLTSSKAYVYYFEHDIKPKVNDLILEVVWDEQQRPIKIEERHLISVVDPKLGVKGRVEFYQIYCRYDPKGVKDDDSLTQY